VVTTNANTSSISLGNIVDIDVDESDRETESADTLAGTLLGTFGSTTDPLWQERATIATEGTDGTIPRDKAGGIALSPMTLVAGPLFRFHHAPR